MAALPLQHQINHQVLFNQLKSIIMLKNYLKPFNGLGLICLLLISSQTFAQRGSGGNNSGSTSCNENFQANYICGYGNVDVFWDIPTSGGYNNSYNVSGITNTNTSISITGDDAIGLSGFTIEASQFYFDEEAASYDIPEKIADITIVRVSPYLGFMCLSTLEVFVSKIMSTCPNGNVTYGIKATVADVDGKTNRFAFSEATTNITHYPNPTGGITHINYSITQDSPVQINLYNIGGQVVQQLENTTQKAGQYRTSFDAAILPEGIYFYTLETETESISKKLIVH